MQTQLESLKDQITLHFFQCAFCGNSSHDLLNFVFPTTGHLTGALPFRSIEPVLMVLLKEKCQEIMQCQIMTKNT
jgi:hypothetical protein